VTVHSCEPASKGGSENAVKIAKAGLVPKEANLREGLRLVRRLRGGVRGVLRTGQQPHPSDHPAGTGGDAGRGAGPAASAAGRSAHSRVRVTRTVAVNTPMVSFEGGQYSVLHPLLGETVWVRSHDVGVGEQVITVHVSATGPVDVAQHARATPGSPELADAHFPPALVDALQRAPKARTADEVGFLALGDGVRSRLTEAAAAGAGRMRLTMAAAGHDVQVRRRRRRRGGLGGRACRGQLPIRRDRPGLDLRPSRPYQARSDPSGR
jgi:hypothetical protein